MKKLGAILLFSVSLTAFAQNSKVISCYNYLGDGDLKNAKEAIDAATVNQTSMNNYKTWMYRAQTYRALATSDKPEYAALKEGALEESIKAYQKVLTIDHKRNPKDKMKHEYSQMAQVAVNTGFDAHDKQDWNNATKYWIMAVDIKQELGTIDTAIMYNIAIIANKGGDSETAIKYFDKCIEYNYKGAYPYANKANLMLEKKDVDGSLAALKAGREKYPNDQMLITKELEIFLANGRNKEALENLNKAIENDGSNYLFFFARGTLYNSEGKLEESRNDYKKAIELQPDHFDSYFNLGASYVNNGAKLAEEAGMIPPSENAKYEAAIKIANEELKQSLPYLEKALELNPKDLPTMESLKGLYANLNMTEKAIEMNKKMQEVQAGGQ